MGQQRGRLRRLAQLLGSGLLAASPAPLLAGETEVQIVRCTEPPTIDGRLDDAVWAHAAMIDHFGQAEPRPGAPPSQRTEARLLYDSNFLYIGVRAFDTDPAAIVAKQMIFDASMRSDDRINIILDTFHDRRNGYFFQLNPLGTRGDALLENNTRFQRQWNGIWYGKSTIDDLGWTAEFAIPFETLNFNPEKDVWGFNVQRRIRRTNEDLRWTDALPNRSLIDVSTIGTIRGLRGMEQGLGIDLKPSMALSYLSEEPSDSDHYLGQPALDLSYKFLPQITGLLTFNTDFSESPVDARQINLGRFALFFPETRDFFLQDAGIFRFGDLADENGLPFFSRRIGLVPGDREVKIRAGAKLTARVGPWNLGLLDVQMEPFGEIDSKNLSVGRLSLDLLEESQVGMIFTNGDPATPDDNWLVGVDGRYRVSDLFGSQIFQADAWFQRTQSTGTSGREAAFGARLAYPNDRINWKLELKEIQENFRPALGFANRVGIRQYGGSFRFRTRPETWLRTVDTQLLGLLVTDRSNRLETGRVLWNLLAFQTNDGDKLTFTYVYDHEELRDEAFEVLDDLFVPTGSYTSHRGRVSLLTSPGRPVQGRLEYGWGGFFSGRRSDVVAALDLRLSRFVFLGLDYAQSAIRLPAGTAHTRLARLDLALMATPDLSWTTAVQYDNVSDTLGMNSRIRWIVQPGNELFLVFNQTYEASAESVHPILSRATFKFRYTFRF